MNMLTRFYQDEAGFVVSSELVLLATILVLGMSVGMVELRNGVLQELQDVAVAFGSISQDYNYTGATGHSSSVAGSLYADETDFCETSLDGAGAAPACMGVSLAAAAE